jgi:hypothetical protein
MHWHTTLNECSAITLDKYGSVAEVAIFGAKAGVRGVGGSELSCMLEIPSRARGFAAKREGIRSLTVSLAGRKDAGGTGVVDSGLPMVRFLDRERGH